jgi:mannose-6-phosphate isomerase-like protein (cupin superfamily)
MNYTKKSYDFKNLNPWLNLLRDDLDLKGVAMGIARIPAGRGYTFIHQHETQEEVYVVLSGKGFLYLDGEHIDLSPGDIVKVDPIAKRAVKAHDDSELVCPHFRCIAGKRFSTKSKQ